MSGEEKPKLVQHELNELKFLLSCLRHFLVGCECCPGCKKCSAAAKHWLGELDKRGIK